MEKPWAAAGGGLLLLLELSFVVSIASLSPGLTTAFMRYAGRDPLKGAILTGADLSRPRRYMRLCVYFFTESIRSLDMGSSSDGFRSARGGGGSNDPSFSPGFAYHLVGTVSSCSELRRSSSSRRATSSSSFALNVWSGIGALPCRLMLSLEVSSATGMIDLVNSSVRSAASFSLSASLISWVVLTISNVWSKIFNWALLVILSNLTAKSLTSLASLSFSAFSLKRTVISLTS
mmetsp:Transcript_19707/g.43064  ORF Transcript_19707/g.43064 Transcript_19707/m.43064 type:complete len:233 (+) Transcript_19707:2179-2877(+)